MPCHCSIDDPCYCLACGPAEIQHHEKKTIHLNIHPGYRTVEAAEKLIDYIQDNIDKAETYIRVRYLENVADPRVWTYRDPFGVCNPGDIVEVRALGVRKPAVVVAPGRGTYTGPTSDILSRLNREKLFNYGR